MTHPTEEQVRKRAYALWELAGWPEGREYEFWLEAERELQNSDPATNPDQKSSTFLE